MIMCELRLPMIQPSAFGSTLLSGAPDWLSSVQHHKLLLMMMMMAVMSSGPG